MRVLPDDVYDTLEFVAYAYGGVGAYHFYADNGDPVCIHGMADFAQRYGILRDALYLADISPPKSDLAVSALVFRHVGLARGEDRVPFARWAKELNVLPARAVA